MLLVLGIAQFSMVGTTVCEVAEVSVDAAGLPTVHRVFCAIDCGRALNPDTIRAQVEGSIVFGLAAALRGRISLKDGWVEQSNFHDYPIPRLGEIPEIEVRIIASDADPTGVGEPATPPIAPTRARRDPRHAGCRPSGDSGRRNCRWFRPTDR